MSGKKKSLLIVDDDRFFAALHSQHLRKAGFEVRLAETCADGFDRARRFRPDLMIIDGLLPDRSGLDLIQSLREDNYRGHILFLSSFWKDIQTFRFLKNEMGVLDILHKPIEPDRLLTEIRSVIDTPIEQAAESDQDLPALLDDDIPPSDGETPQEKLEAHQNQGLSSEPSEERPPEQPDPLTRLVEAYQGTVPKKVEEIYGLWCRDRKGNLDEIRRAVHSLHGTAGTYGLHELSEAAGDLDEWLVPLMAEVPVQENVLTARWKTLLAAAGVDASGQADPKESKRLSPRPGKARSRPKEDPTGRLKVVLFDTDKEALAELTQMAEVSMVDIVKSTDEEEIIELLESENPDGIFVCETGSDVKNRAWRLIRRIRFAYPESELPIVFVSDNQDLRARISAHQAGCTLFLNKPVRPKELQDSVRIMGNLRRQGRARVFMIDDDPGFLNYIAMQLSDAGFDVSATNHPEELFELLDEVDPEILLLDMVMPKYSGMDLCRMLRTLPKWYDLPIVLMTADVSENNRIAAFEAGADDYIAKPVVIKELIARISVRVERNRILRDRIDRDPLTGAHLRRSFVERSRAALAENRRFEKPGSLAMLDLDNFKHINDNYGHAMGDTVLVALGALILGRVRGNDIVGRWGGEEFALYLPNAEPEQARTILEEILGELSLRSFGKGETDRFHVTFSAGIASIHEIDGMLGQLINLADERMYQAKRAGKNRIFDASE